MDDSFFDVAILGTGLTESIVAAALAKAGYKVVHIDENPYYGGQEASLTVEELVTWADASSNTPRVTSITRSADTLPQSRQYSICLRPSFLPSAGPIISALILSGVAKYGGFRLLERVAIYDRPGIIKNVPGTKEDVFKDASIGLVDKRRLMRFLSFAISDFESAERLRDKQHYPFSEFLKQDFSLNDEMTNTIVYSIAYCTSPSDPTLPALQRIRRYLTSAGRYGPSPYLVGHYGGTGEIAQGFCRAAAVSGGVYILGRRINSIKRLPPQPDSAPRTPRYSVDLEDVPETLTCSILVSSARLVPQDFAQDVMQISSAVFDRTHSSLSVARCIAIVNRPVHFPPLQTSETEEEEEDGESSPQSTSTLPHQIDTGFLVFPPSSVPGGSTTHAASVFIAGEGSMSTPAGKWILYISLPLVHSGEDSDDPKQLLHPYLDAVLALTVATETSTPGTEPSQSKPSPIFTMFYMEHSQPDYKSTGSQTYIVTPSLFPALPLSDIADASATYAETVFWEVVRQLRGAAGPTTSNDTEISSFWPLLDTGDDEE